MPEFNSCAAYAPTLRKAMPYGMKHVRNVMRAFTPPYRVAFATAPALRRSIAATDPAAFATAARTASAEASDTDPGSGIIARDREPEDGGRACAVTSSFLRQLHRQLGCHSDDAKRLCAPVRMAMLTNQCAHQNRGRNPWTNTEWVLT